MQSLLFEETSATVMEFATWAAGTCVEELKAQHTRSQAALAAKHTQMVLDLREVHKVTCKEKVKEAHKTLSDKVGDTLVTNHPYDPRQAMPGHARSQPSRH